MLASLAASSAGGADALDVFYLLIVLAMIAGVFWIARRLTSWSKVHFERRMGNKRSTREPERIETLRELAELRDSGSLSKAEFEAARARVLRE